MPNFLCHTCNKLLPDSECKVFQHRAFCPVCRQEMRLAQHEEVQISEPISAESMTTVETQLNRGGDHPSTVVDDVILACQTALAKNSLDSSALLNITKRYLSLNQFEDAHRYYNRLLALNEKSEALDELTALIQSDSVKEKWLSSELKKCQQFLDREQFPNAKKALSVAMKIDGEHIKTLQCAASFYQLSNDPKSTLIYLRKLSELTPNDPFVYMNIAQIYLELNHVEKAERALKKATQYDSKKQCLDDIKLLLAECKKRA